MAEVTTTTTEAPVSPQTGGGPGPTANTAISNMGGPPSGRGGASNGQPAFHDDGTIEVDESDTVDEVENLDDDTIDAAAAPGKETKEVAEAPDDLEAKLAGLGLNPKQHADMLALIREQFAPKQPEGKDAAPSPTTVDLDQALREVAAEFDGKPAADPAAAAAAPGAPGTAPQQDDAGPLKFGDIGDQFAEAEDFYKAKLEAETSGDFRKVKDIEVAAFDRMLYNRMPAMAKLVSRLAQAEVRKLVPENMRQEYERSWSERTEVEMREKVEESLRTKLGEGFSRMLSEDGGKPVEWQGKQMSPIPYNRIVALQPYIGKIREHHADPTVAARLTWLARYGEAYRIYQRQATEAQRIEKVAKQAAAASAKSATRTERERGRSGVSAGGRSTGQFNGSERTPEEARQFIRENLPGDSYRKLSKI